MADDVHNSKSDRIGDDEFRMLLQLETSLLMWLRTSLALMGFGFVIARFGLFLREIAHASEINIHPHTWLTAVNTWSGTGLIILGIIVMLLAVRGHQQSIDRLHRGELRLPPRWSLSVIVCLMVAAIGMAMAIFLALV